MDNELKELLKKLSMNQLDETMLNLSHSYKESIDNAFANGSNSVEQLGRIIQMNESMNKVSSHILEVLKEHNLDFYKESDDLGTSNLITYINLAYLGGEVN